MVKKARSINLFLMDGEPTGRIKATLANWTGLAYKIPRIATNKCKDREDLNQSGVYFLLGNEDDKEVIYIGQAGNRKNADGIICRLLEHKRNVDKSYWNEAIVLTTSNNSFGPTEISYLENRFYNIAVEAQRAIVKNTLEPTAGNITEEKESELEEFIENAKVLIGTLGYRFLEPVVVQEDIEENEDSDILYLTRNSKKNNNEIKAMCKQTNEGFVILKGSQIEKNNAETLPLSIIERRKNVKMSSDNVLQENIVCTSPSYAASFVTGNRENGLLVWKNVNGIKLKEIEVESEQVCK